ncbi:MAG TPA: hypothetical protein VN922_05850, partial [Bacteroidia bacterium]|nr:hypothetical protein [Bacteroidia bacterium]
LKGMNKWIMNYERRRCKNRGPNENWISDKYDLQGDWRDVQQTLTNIKDRKGRFLNIGEVTSALKRSWKAYRIAGQNGEPRRDIAWRINYLEDGLGLIEKATFPELADIGVYGQDFQQENPEIFDDPDLSREEILQLRREERQDQLDMQHEQLRKKFGDRLMDDSADDRSDIAETSLDRQLIDEEEYERQELVQEMIRDIEGNH